MHHVDGNVLAGHVGTVFSFEPTTAQGQCDACEEIAVLGKAMVYRHPMGSVVRCRSCDSVLMVIVEREGQSSLSMRGLRWLRSAEPDS